MAIRPFELILNPSAISGAPYGPEQAEVLNTDGLARARSVIAAWPGYSPTPLVDLDGIARFTGIARLHYKDEGQRFGLKSFKPLGGAYAVARLLLDHLPAKTGAAEVTVADLLAGTFRKHCAEITVTAATDGNHGRSVAWGARMFGCRCVIFINEAVSVGRERAIASFGAEVRRNPGSFDDAVRTAQQTAVSEGWHVIPDTSDGVIVEAPRNVTQGYAVMAAEAIEQLPHDGLPTHIFLQAGVGGMAAATCGQFWQVFNERKPKIILVEPENSACWFESLKAGQPVSIGGALDSLMGGLACGEVSRLAWKILKTGADAAMKLPDEAAAETMRLLAEGRHGDAPLVAGESGVAGLAGYLAVAGDPRARQLLGLDENARVLVFGTEGATDPDTYREIVGRSPEEVSS
ncbi:MAG: diaminopropionate ammonia-lyase [Pseudomonadota bacterium]